MRKLLILFAILINPYALLCFKNMFNFLSNTRSAGLPTRACLLYLKVPYSRSNSGKHTFSFNSFPSDRLLNLFHL